MESSASSNSISNGQAQGVNVVGHISASAGLGGVSRALIRAMIDRGIPVAVLDIDMGLQRAHSSADELPDQVLRVARVEDLPYSINLVNVAIQLLPSVFLRRFPELLAPRFLNAAIVFWELPVLPRVWVRALRLCDACVVCSPFLRALIERHLPEMPTVYAEYPLYMPSVTAVERSTLGFTESTVLFGASFDLAGDPARKNPLAILRAFAEAFPGDEDVGLILKGNGRVNNLARHPIGRGIEHATRTDPRIRFVVSTLPYRDVIALYAACDAYVSLHRAEGLGLGPMEAMALGKPVVATGYSGNMGYMTESNALLVRYVLVPTGGCEWQYSRAFSGKGAVWAEPDVRHAATLLRSLAENADLRRSIGLTAKRDIAERQQVAYRATFVDTLYWALARSPAMRRRRGKWLKTWMAEISDPSLTRRNLKALAARLHKER